MARFQSIKARCYGSNFEEHLLRWQRLRSSFISSWEKSERDYQRGCIERAVGMGSNAVWRLLNINTTSTSRSLLSKDGLVLTNPAKISKELKRHHKASTDEYKAVTPGDHTQVNWDSPFLSSDLVLEITDELVATNVMKLKNTTVPDDTLPMIIKLLFGSPDSVGPLSKMIQAVARTRIFPKMGKVAKQTFL